VVSWVEGESRDGPQLVESAFRPPEPEVAQWCVKELKRLEFAQLRPVKTNAYVSGADSARRVPLAGPSAHSDPGLTGIDSQSAGELWLAKVRAGYR
jgi:hypothetical protein